FAILINVAHGFVRHMFSLGTFIRGYITSGKTFIVSTAMKNIPWGFCQYLLSLVI
ncbi:hypothetical protein ACJX0J_030391, partial [Zea mays]